MTYSFWEPPPLENDRHLGIEAEIYTYFCKHHSASAYSYYRHTETESDEGLLTASIEASVLDGLGIHVRPEHQLVLGIVIHTYGVQLKAQLLTYKSHVCVCVFNSGITDKIRLFIIENLTYIHRTLFLNIYTINVKRNTTTPVGVTTRAIA